MAKKIGRPTDYDPKYCQAILDFFNVDPTRETMKTITTKNGTVIEEESEIATKMPFMVDFCDKIGISRSTLHNWTREHPEFMDAYTRAKEYQERHLVNNALLGNYNPGFAALVAKNWLGWKDKHDVTTDGKALPTPIYGGMSGRPDDVQLQRHNSDEEDISTQEED